ncbi:MAG: RidA family protein [Elusimicrobia bacterium]|nr:RidA family protein [Elusimicrobiota bacterium]
MTKKIISTDLAPAAIGPYSQATEFHNLIFISGQLPINPATGEMLEADIEKQTRQCLVNMEAILKEAGLELSNVLKTTVLMTNLKQFAQMNAVYAEFFKENPPARAAFEVKALPKDSLVEIEAIAAKEAK